VTAKFERCVKEIRLTSVVLVGAAGSAETPSGGGVLR
jgi:hypothetical protein